MEEEAIRNLCKRSISVVRSKQQHLSSPSEEKRSRHKGAGGMERSKCERQVEAGHEFSPRDHREGNLPHPGCSSKEREQPSLRLTDRPVPLQIISMLRLKTFKEELRRGAEEELRDPAVCSVCEQEQACLALKSFIRRKKTQLQFETLKGRLNTHLSCGGSKSEDRRAQYKSGTSNKPVVDNSHRQLTPLMN